MPIQTYVAFLRGINLGKRRVTMARLAEVFEAAGFTGVGTFIASGNVVFRSGTRDGLALESRIEKHLAGSLGYEVETFVRTIEDVARIARSGVLPDPVGGDPKAAVHVGFLKGELPEVQARGLEAVRTPLDEFRVVGGEYYWCCRAGISQSDVWTRPEVRALKLPSSTLRKMTTVRELVARFGAVGLGTGS